MRLVRSSYLFPIASAALLAACSSPKVGRGPKGTGGQPGSADGGTSGDAGGGNPPLPPGGGGDQNCGEQSFMLNKKGPADLLILQDRSKSMTEKAGSSTRWEQIVPAIEGVVQKISSVNWGLMLFASDQECTVPSTPDVAPAPNTSAAIKMALDQTKPDSRTPTGAAVTSAAKYMSSVSDGNPHYLLLATDGEPNCGDNEDSTVQAITDAAKAGMHTFVVGIGADFDDTSLNNMANAGLEPNTKGGDKTYYEVTTTDDLIAVLNTVAGKLVSCSYPLTVVPMYPDLVTVQANGKELPRDKTHMDGWDLGPNNASIIFYGAACEALQNGSTTQVGAIYKCPPIG